VALARAELRTEPAAAPKPAAAKKADRGQAGAEKPKTTTTTTKARVYTVRAGDTLGSIAQSTGVPLERLRRLNPKLEPTALFIGQQLRLR
jgi:LysM repeat protein